MKTQFLPPPIDSPFLARPALVVAEQREAEPLFGSTEFHRWLDQNQSFAFDVLLGLVAGSAFLLVSHWLLRRASRRGQRDTAEVRADLESVLKALPDPLFEVDRDGRLLRFFGQHPVWRRAADGELLGRTFDQVLPAAAAEVYREAIREADRQGSSLGHQVELTLKGTTTWLELSVAKRSAVSPAQDRFLLLSRDITSTVEAINTNQRLLRLYETLHRCNLAIVTSTSRQELFDRVCSLAVESLEVKMVWVGLVDATTGAIQAVASDGQGTDYVNRLNLSVRADHPGGVGPTGTALREGIPYWVADFLHDPMTARWHDFGREFGWRASVSLPLRLRGEVMGGLTFYFGESFPRLAVSPQTLGETAKGSPSFDPQTQKLLLDLAHDVEIALERFAKEEENLLLQGNLKTSESKFRQLTESISDVVWSLDPHSLRFLYVSPSVLRQRGLGDEAVLAVPAQQAFMAMSFEVLHAQVIQMEEAFAAGRLSHVSSRPLELQQPHADGSVVWTETTLTPVVNDRTGLLEVHGLSRDITRRKLAEERGDRLAFFDQRTGLPNRTQLELLANEALRRAEGNQASVALLCLDLDNFKVINETYGFEVGDRLLIEVADRMRAGLRHSDCLARFEGDNFMVLLPGTDPAGALHLAATLLKLVDRPVTVSGHEIRISGSIGVSSFPVDGDDIGTLVRKADISARTAQGLGRNQICEFNPELLAGSERSLELARDLQQAITREQLVVHYQPQVDLRSGRIVGAEALLRWNHHRLGAISPGEFIPIAERHGLIGSIGEWVLQQALLRLRTWLDQARPPLLVAVNLSALQFRNPNLVTDIRTLLRLTNVPGFCLELELTESSTVDDPSSAVRIMRELSDLGIRLSIDDFGTGYSSFNYLSQMKVNKLKIDQSFVRDLEAVEQDRLIVRGLIQMAQSLSLTTIAEGVETPGQLVFLRDEGCDEIQGYLFSRPLPVDDFERLLADPPDLAALALG